MRAYEVVETKVIVQSLIHSEINECTLTTLVRQLDWLCNVLCRESRGISSASAFGNKGVVNLLLLHPRNPRASVAAFIDPRGSFSAFDFSVDQNLCHSFHTS